MTDPPQEENHLIKLKGASSARRKPLDKTEMRMAYIYWAGLLP
jgi:hypothetical protein